MMLDHTLEDRGVSLDDTLETARVALVGAMKQGELLVFSLQGAAPDFGTQGMQLWEWVSLVLVSISSPHRACHM